MTLIVTIFLLPLLIVTAFFALELLCGLGPLRATTKSVPEQNSARTMIVIPAHNEEAILAKSLSAMRAHAGDIPILLVADNCSDRTAVIARECGVEVLERHNEQDRGKGFALAHAATAIADRAIDVVIVVDADCRMDGDSLRALAEAAHRRNSPAQAFNWMVGGADTPLLVRISNFAFLIKNLVRQRGLQRLAGHAHLTGTGMAIPKSMFAAERLAPSSIVEDMKLGLESADQGRPVLFVEEARVTSPSADTRSTLEQRKRWEGGYFTLASAIALPLLWRGIRTFDPRKIASALDLSIPPLVVFVAVSLAALAVELLLAILGITAWVLPAVHLTIFGTAILGLSLAWWTVGRDVLTIGDLLRIPAYMLWKIPMYLGLAKQGAPQEWTRTTRLEETKQD